MPKQFAVSGSHYTDLLNSVATFWMNIGVGGRKERKKNRKVPGVGRFAGAWSS
jgi:hypothetical protein